MSHQDRVGCHPQVDLKAVCSHETSDQCFVQKHFFIIQLHCTVKRVVFNSALLVGSRCAEPRNPTPDLRALTGELT